jgi:hypothetical protein
MSEQVGSDDREAKAVPADLPYVDGRNISPAELRAEVAKESDPQVQHIEEVRDELVDVVDELGRRAAPRSWVGRVPSGVWAGLVAAAAAASALVFLQRRRKSRRT